MAETELERAEKRFAQAKARLQGLRNREATKQRKMDTRRKVILGGALIDLAARDDRAVEMLERLMRNLVREQDRAAFEGWDWRAEKSDADTGDNAGAVGETGAADGGGVAGAGGAEDLDGGNAGIVPAAAESSAGDSSDVGDRAAGATSANVPDNAQDTPATAFRHPTLSRSIGPIRDFRSDRPLRAPLPDMSGE